ncbi:hypothetical protein [Candidatus Poriferisodalis sp.]|uniref:hypothetical protein n=1 Tax=Candidatus Poriferisodalis sp. TaxID=3101277 RepID=UPI003B02C2E9
MVRQRLTRAAGRLLALLGIVATAWALTGCGGGESGVVAAEGSDDANQAVDTEADKHADERIETVAGEDASSQSAAQSDRIDATAITDDDNAGVSTPQGASTGPLLQWSEFHPGVSGFGGLSSIGDGRVVIREETSAGASLLVSTSDGSDWSVVSLPAAVSPHAFDLTGERWAVAGWSHEDPSDADFSGRIYVSDDRGVSWTEARLRVDPPDLPEHTIAHSSVAAVATSGPHVVAVVRTHFSLDFEALLRDRGLLPPGTRPHWISIAGDGFGFDMSFDVLEESASDGAQPGGASGVSAEPLTFTVDELGLSAEQMAIIEGAHEPGSICVYSGSGPELAETAVVDGWLAGGIGTDDSFALLVDSGRDGLTMFTSADGRAWDSHAVDLSSAQGWFSGAVLEPDGTVWMTSSDGRGSSLTRWSDSGNDVRTTWLGDLSRFGEFSVGPAGLAATAMPSRPELSGGGSDDSGLPVGRVAKDGYELRYGEPEGGITLWDLTADSPVYVFGPEIIESAEPPEGVREVEEGDVFELTFEDPDTGEDLVTFTMEDLEAVFGDQMETLDSHSPEMWVGWSANGTAWGWQTVQEAFGIGDVDAHVTVAVGGDFVVASVHVFEPLGTSSLREGGSADGGAVVASTVAREQRWFIARVP